MMAGNGTQGKGLTVSADQSTARAHLPLSIWSRLMTDVQTSRFFQVTTNVVRALGPTWQFFIPDGVTQIIAFPIDRTIHLRFAKAGGAAPAIAVEMVDENGSPIALPPDPAIWLAPLDVAAATIARQIRNNLIAPCQKDVAVHVASVA